MNFIHSLIDPLRDRYAPISHTSTFRQTGQITPEEFIRAGDFLVYKFPSWSWSDAAHPSKRVSYLPDNKQFLVTRGVPCHRRLDDHYDAGEEEIVKDMLGRPTKEDVGDGNEDEDGWLSTGRGGDPRAEATQRKLERDVRTIDGSGNVGEAQEVEEEDEIPDLEDEEDDEEAIIREPQEGTGTKAPLRTYTLYVTYTPYYRTPRFYLSGYSAASQPLPPTAMMEDIVGDYKDKTVTLEDFPFADAGSVKMVSIHPCRHASVMKTQLDRADAALKLRQERLHRSGDAGAESSGAGTEGLIEDTSNLSLSARDRERKGHSAGVAVAGGNGGDEWEVLQHESHGEGEEETAIRVDQYLVVFLKFMASVTPTIEHDFTMGV